MPRDKMHMSPAQLANIENHKFKPGRAETREAEASGNGKETE